MTFHIGSILPKNKKSLTRTRAVAKSHGKNGKKKVADSGICLFIGPSGPLSLCLEAFVFGLLFVESCFLVIGGTWRLATVADPAL